MTGRRSGVRSRARLRADSQRIAEGMSYPGIDPRTWVSMARIDDDEDAIVWNEDLGWLVDVTFVGGEFDGEGPVNCRVASMLQVSGVTHQRPSHAGALVVVVIPNGDPNDDAVIVAQLHDVDDQSAPTEVNETSIDEDFAQETHVTVAPEEDLDQQWRNTRITAESMIFGTHDANQPYVRGDDLSSALDSLVDAISEFAAAIAVAPVNIGTAVVALDPASLTSLQIAISNFKNASENYLSTRIKGD